MSGRERLQGLQRARILAAVTELTHERGAGGITVARIVARSGVSRRTFYEQFDDREQCQLAAFDRAVERVAAVVLPAYGTGDATDARRWEEKLRAALAALLRFLDEQPALGGLLIVDSLAGERQMLDRRTRLVDTLVDVFSREQHSTRDGITDRLIAEGTVGSVLAVIHRRLLEPDLRSLQALLNPLMAMIVLPHLGSRAAQRELARPSPRARRRAAVVANPLRSLDMRLTYRTVRVLLAISDFADRGVLPSGRQIADASGISDQGQMSKLLTRLEHLELIRNDAAHRGAGEPNAWTLTVKGREVEHVIRPQTAA